MTAVQTLAQEVLTIVNEVEARERQLNEKFNRLASRLQKTVYEAYVKPVIEAMGMLKRVAEIVKVKFKVDRSMILPDEWFKEIKLEPAHVQEVEVEYYVSPPELIVAVFNAGGKREYRFLMDKKEEYDPDTFEAALLFLKNPWLADLIVEEVKKRLIDLKAEYEKKRLRLETIEKTIDELEQEVTQLEQKLK